MNFKALLKKIPFIGQKMLNADQGWRFIIFNGDSSDIEFQGLVWRCVDIIGNAVSKVAFYHEDLNGNEIKNSSFMAEFGRPNPRQTKADLIKALITLYFQDGVAYLYRTEDGQMYPLSRMNVRPKNNYQDYDIVLGTSSKTVPKAQIIEFSTIDPKNPNEFLSPIRKAMLDISNDIEAAKHNKYTLKNSANPSMFVSFSGSLGKDEFEQAKAKIEKQYTGAQNAGKILFGDENLKAQTLQLTNKDLEYNEGRKFSRDNVLALIGVPKPLLFSEDVNLANAKAAMDHFLTFTVAPLAEWFAQKLSLYLAFSDDPQFKNTQITYDDPSPKDREFNLKLAQAGNGSFLDEDEVRELVGYGPRGTTKALSVGRTGRKNYDKMQNAMAMYRRKGSSLGQEIDKLRERSVSKSEKALQSASIKYIQRYINLMQSQKALVPSVHDMAENEKLFANDIYTIENNLMQEAIKNNDAAFQTNIAGTLDGVIKMAAYTRAKKIAHETGLTLINDTKAFVDAKEKEDAQAQQKAFDREALKKELIDKFGSEKDYRAERIMRTESISAYREGSWISYKKLGVKSVEWDALNDACPVCEQNDKKVRAMGETFPSGDIAETAHPNCRCVTVPSLANIESEKDFSKSSTVNEAFKWVGIDNSDQQERNDTVAKSFNTTFPDLAGFTDNFNFTKKLISMDQMKIFIAAEPDKVAKYENAFKNGEKFPPIMATKLGDDLPVTLDGAHRLEALRNLGAKYIYILLGIPK